MDRVRVSSSNLRSVGYEASSRTLEVEFINGTVCQYRAVPEQTHAGLMRSASKGSYFADHIRDRFACRKVR